MLLKASRRWRGPSTPSTQDRRQDAASYVVERVRQADVVVELDIDQIAELGEVDVPTSIFIRPSK